jgi:hypothetical protein
VIDDTRSEQVEADFGSRQGKVTTLRSRDWTKVGRAFASYEGAKALPPPSFSAQSESLDKRRYILCDGEGDYVSKVESAGFETVKVKFHFTSVKEKAKRFSYNDLASPLATTSIGIEFQHGFSGGQLIRVK